MSQPTTPGLYRATLGTIDERMLVEVMQFGSGLSCSVMGSDELIDLSAFSDWERVRVVPFSHFAGVPGAMCPHCGRQGIQNYDQEPCLCPDCGKDIDVRSCT